MDNLTGKRVLEHVRATAERWLAALDRGEPLTADDVGAVLAVLRGAVYWGLPDTRPGGSADRPTRLSTGYLAGDAPLARRRPSRRIGCPCAETESAVAHVERRCRRHGPRHRRQPIRGQDRRPLRLHAGTLGPVATGQGVLWRLATDPHAERHDLHRLDGRLSRIRRTRTTNGRSATPRTMTSRPTCARGPSRTATTQTSGSRSVGMRVSTCCPRPGSACRGRRTAGTAEPSAVWRIAAASAFGSRPIACDRLTA